MTDFVTGGAPGVVVMATNYNADEPAYTTKQAMENSEYAVSVKPTCNLMHGVECASNQTVLSELYVRPGGLASNLDLKFTDLGNFQFASQGNPVQLLGELWVSYTVEFFKPVLPNDVGGNVQSGSTTRANVAAGVPLGTIQQVITGDLVGFAVTSTTVSWLGQPGNLYLIATNWSGNAAVAITYPTTTFTNCAFQPAFFNDTSAATQSPANGVSSFFMNQNTVVVCNATAPALCTITFAAGTFPGGPVSLDLLITQVSDNI